MMSTFKSKEDFIAAVSSKLDPTQTSQDVRSALISGISSADDVLRSQVTGSKSLALNLKIGTWVIRDDDLPLFRALSTTGAAIALILTTGGMAGPAAWAALSSFAELCWQAWRKGAHLSSLQVAVYGFLQARGPMKSDAVFDYLKGRYSEATSPDIVKAALESLRELDTNDGHVIALASGDNNDVGKH